MRGSNNTPLILSGSAVIVATATAAYACYKIQSLETITDIHERDMGSIANRLKDMSYDITDISQTLQEKLEIIEEHGESIRKLSREIKALSKRLDSSHNTKHKALSSSSSSNDEEDIGAMITELRRKRK